MAHKIQFVALVHSVLSIYSLTSDLLQNDLLRHLNSQHIPLEYKIRRPLTVSFVAHLFLCIRVSHVVIHFVRWIENISETFNV